LAAPREIEAGRVGHPGHRAGQLRLGEGEALPKGVRGYPCREAHGLIFVFPGDIRKLGDAEFPDIPSHADPNYKTRYLDREVGCHYSFMHENLMDMNHQFLHRRIMARIQTSFLDLREGDDWVEVDYTFSRVGKQPIGERFKEAQKKQTADFMASKHSPEVAESYFLEVGPDKKHCSLRAALKRDHPDLFG